MIYLTGDKIKGLTISFDDIFLRDAIDILNCGAPYKLRLLLEKQAALLLPNSINSRQQMTNNGTNSANSLAKNCIKKITSFCSPNGASPFNANNSQSPLTLEQQMNRSKKYVINVDSLSSVNNVAIDVSSHDQLSNILGSISARRARDLNQNRSTFIDYNTNSNTNNKQTDNNNTNTDHIYIGGDGDDSVMMDTRDQIVENFDDEDDNSLQFNRNDSHHLHGPSHRRATVAQTTNIQAIGTSIDGTQNDRPFLGLGINNNNHHHHHLTDHSQSRHPMDNNQQVEQTRSQPTIAVARRDSDLGISPSQQAQQNKRFSPNKYFASTVAVSTPAMNFTPHSQSNIMTTGNNNNNNNLDNNNTDQMMSKQRPRPMETTTANGSNRTSNSTVNTCSNSQFSSIEEMSFDETKEAITDNKNDTSKNVIINESIQRTDGNFESSNRKSSDSATSNNGSNHQQVRGHRRLKSTGGNLDIMLDNVKKEHDSTKIKPATINELPSHGDGMAAEGADKHEQLARNNRRSSSHKSSTSEGSRESHNYATDQANQPGQANNKTPTVSHIENSLASPSPSDPSINVRPIANLSSLQPTTLVVTSPNQQITDTRLIEVNDITETGDAIKDNNDRKDSTSENKTN